MDKNKDLNKNKIPSNIKKIPKGIINKSEKEKNKIQNKKNSKKYIITFKKYSIDKNDLIIKTNDNNDINNNISSDIFDNKKILKTEIYNNKRIIIEPKYKEKEKEISTNYIDNSKERKNSKENFGEYILQKKIKLFSLTNDNNNNNKNNTYTINIKESNIGSISSKNISHDKNQIMTEINQPKLNDKSTKKNIILSVKLNNEEKKIPRKKLKLEINKYNNKYNGEKEEKETLKLETKINKNREILFKSSEKNNISPKRIKTNNNIFPDEEKKNKNEKNNLNVKINSYKKGNSDKNEINKIFLKENNNKLFNSNKNLIKKEKEKEIELPNKAIPKNKEETFKKKIINFKKIKKTPIKIDINLDNSNDKILLSQKDLLNKKEKNILSILKETKIPSIKTEKENIKDNSSKNIKEENKNHFNIFKQMKSINERKENKKIKLEIDTFEKSTKNKIEKDNHYKAFLTEVLNEKSSRTLKPKKKYKFSERKKNGTNKDLKIKLLESAENYYDLYNKHFNDTSSLEQIFSFKPKMNKIYINYNNTFHKKLSNPSFIPKAKGNIEQKNKNKKKTLNSFDNINDKFFNDMNNLKDEDESNNNKNLILDLNHYIPIDQNKLINTFTKTLFNNENKPIINK